MSWRVFNLVSDRINIKPFVMNATDTSHFGYRRPFSYCVHSMSNSEYVLRSLARWERCLLIPERFASQFFIRELWKCSRKLLRDQIGVEQKLNRANAAIPLKHHLTPTLDCRDYPLP